MSTAANKPWISEEEYLRLEPPEGVRYEYFQGEIFAMVGGTPNHSRMKMSLSGALENALQGGRCEAFDSDLRIKVQATGLYTYPDFSICCGPAEWEKETTLLNPTVLIEVLSPSTEAYDRGTEFLHYQQIASLQHYVLVFQDELRIEVHTRQGTKNWLMTPYMALTDSVDLKSIGICLSVEQIYRRVEVGKSTLHPSMPVGEPA